MLNPVKLYLSLFFILLFNCCVFAQKENSLAILISNSTPILFEEYVINIPWTAVVEKSSLVAKFDFRLIDDSTQKELPYQIEFRGQPSPQQLLVQISVPPHAKKVIRLEKGSHSPFMTKTFCRYVPERKDDFAWENDRIAFRMYGKALEGTKENANGIDVWVKRTDQMVINNRYQRGEYHIDHGDGMDYYHVGLSLGAGNIAPIIDDSIYYPTNYRTWEILDNGPLRSTFRLTYDAWNVAGKKVTMTKTVTLDAGMQLSRVETAYAYDMVDTLPVAIGITRRKDPGTVLFDLSLGLMGYWEPSHLQHGTTGVGCIFLQPVADIKITNNHFLALLKTNKQTPLVYYTGAAWDKAKRITDSSAWFNYLTIIKQQLANPLQIAISPF
ncbi:MAG: DUF4861 domain-containing protein [Bacteroidetes bacterium]|nr:DUF4861 domain-containing protein [Bacteroidota bacterium]